MFDTGIKESIVNLAADVTYTATSGSIPGVLAIDSVGKFDISKIKKLSIAAPIAERTSSVVGDTITIADTGDATTAGDLITVDLVFKSLKAGFADFDNCNITGGKSLSLSFAYVSEADTVTKLVTVLNSADTSYGISLAADGAGDTVTIKYTDTSVYLDSITFGEVHNTSSTIVGTIETSSYPAILGRNTAKELRDSVRAATLANEGSQSNTLERQIQDVGYYALSFSYDSTTTNSGTGFAVNGVPSRTSDFVIYINEDSYSPDIVSGTTDVISLFWIGYVAQTAVTIAWDTDSATTIKAWLASDYAPIYVSTSDAITYPDTTA